ncbi:hypothetical protein [Micromonospora sp. DH14]|nr:hypothetical protein [Micromonospora sp. DH14]MDG9676984.1 hypothetical protein [Micromonospora sp. DH14]
MSTTTVGADDPGWVDGHALAGPLGEIMGTLRGSLVVSLPLPRA